MKREVRHIPVLLNEVLDALRPDAGDIVVDCTLGLGGHSVELLKRVQPDGKLIALDFDASNIERNLYLLAQILELQLPVVVALNMVDVAEENGVRIDGEVVSDRERAFAAPAEFLLQVGKRNFRRVRLT